MDPFRLDPRSREEMLADAERYERWAERTRLSPEISVRFARLATSARMRAGE